LGGGEVGAHVRRERGGRSRVEKAGNGRGADSGHRVLAPRQKEVGAPPSSVKTLRSAQPNSNTAWRRGRAPAPARSPPSIAVAGRPDEITSRFLVALELEASAPLGFLEHPVERAESIVGLVEAGLAALERLLDHRAPHFLLVAPLGNERLHRPDDQIERLLATLVVAPFRGRRALVGDRLRRGLLRSRGRSRGRL